MENEGVRRRHVEKRETQESISATEVIKKIDAFYKVPDDCVEKSAGGGGLTVLTFGVIVILIFMEIYSFLQPSIQYDFKICNTLKSAIELNIDITVASPCSDIGADAFDSEETLILNSNLREEDVNFNLWPKVQTMWDDLNRFQENRRQDPALHKLTLTQMLQGQRRIFSNYDTSNPNACRIHGTVVIKRIAGSFHIVTGKPMLFFGAHTHLQTMVVENGAISTKTGNFSHRIAHFSFGKRQDKLIGALDGETKISESGSIQYQYFVKVVSTDIDTWQHRLSTNQISVTETVRKLDHSSGVHGNPGILFKYDFSPLRIVARETHPHFFLFIFKLAGIVGGVFATSGALHAFTFYTFQKIFPSKSPFAPLQSNT